MANEILYKTSYNVNPVKPIFTICTNNVDINTFLASFIFSFFSSSLYLGFIINIEAIKTKDVNKYVNAPSIPNLIAYPINPDINIPKTGIEFPRPAATTLIPNGENWSLIPTIDIIRDII